MENIMNLILKNWSTILEYVLMFLSYFFVFLYRSKIQNTRNNLSIEYKANRTYMSQQIKLAQDKYEEKAAAFDKAVNDIETMKRAIVRHQATLEILVNPKEVIIDEHADGKNVPGIE